MTTPLPAVTLHVPTPQWPVLCTRLTTYLLHHDYAFLQTCYDPTHTDFEIFQQHQPLVRLSLRSTAVHSAAPGLTSVPPLTPGTAAAAIIHHLLQAVPPLAGPGAEQGALV